MTRRDDALATDEALWDRAREGDRAALDAVLRRYEKSIYRFGLRMCGDEEAAKEVLQRTLLAAFENLASFRGEARPTTWLYALARSACGRVHRRTRSAPVHDVALDGPEESPDLESDEATPAQSLESAEMAELVATAIKLLPDAYREVVVLRDVEGLPAEEAAVILKLAIPALKSRLHRGRAQLKKNLVTLLQKSGGQVGQAHTCPGLAAELAKYEGQEVDRAACAAIEDHLTTCAVCSKELGGLRDTAALCRQLPGGDVPRPVKAAVRTALVNALGAEETGPHDDEDD